jgi:hypothetical protein
MDLIPTQTSSITRSHPFNITCDNIVDCMYRIGVPDSKICPDYVLSSNGVLNELLYPISRSITIALNDSHIFHDPQEKSFKRRFRELDPNDKFRKFTLGPFDTYGKYYNPFTDDYLEQNETLSENVEEGKTYGVAFESFNRVVQIPKYVPAFLGQAYINRVLSRREPTRSCFLKVDVINTNGFETRSEKVKYVFRFVVCGQQIEFEYLEFLIPLIMQPLVDYVGTEEIFRIDFKQGNYIACRSYDERDEYYYM